MGGCNEQNAKGTIMSMFNAIYYAMLIQRLNNFHENFKQLFYSRD